MINCYIATYNDIRLSVGAAQSLRNNLLNNDLNIILINGGSKKIYHSIFDTIINLEFGRWFGFIRAQQLSDDRFINLYLDDDMRLLTKTDISIRYPTNHNQYYMPNNGYMLQLWQKQYKNPNDTKKLLVKRIKDIKNIKIDIDQELKILITNNQSQIIDDIWLHIDKGSENLTTNRSLLINYIDQ